MCLLVREQLLQRLFVPRLVTGTAGPASKKWTINLTISCLPNQNTSGKWRVKQRNDGMMECRQFWSTSSRSCKLRNTNAAQMHTGSMNWHEVALLLQQQSVPELERWWRHGEMVKIEEICGILSICGLYIMTEVLFEVILGLSSAENVRSVWDANCDCVAFWIIQDKKSSWSQRSQIPWVIVETWWVENQFELPFVKSRVNYFSIQQLHQEESTLLELLLYHEMLETQLFSSARSFTNPGPASNTHFTRSRFTWSLMPW